MRETPVNVVSAALVGEHLMRIAFDDGTTQEIDFKPFLAHSRHPSLRAYLDPVRFASFRVEYGELVWGDYELCFPVIDLYRNRIEPIAAEAAAA